MYHLNNVPTKSSSFYFTLSLLQFLCDMDCKADDALSFLMTENVNFKSGLNKIQPLMHVLSFVNVICIMICDDLKE